MADRCYWRCRAIAGNEHRLADGIDGPARLAHRRSAMSGCTTRRQMDPGRPGGTCAGRRPRPRRTGDIGPGPGAGQVAIDYLQRESRKRTEWQARATASAESWERVEEESPPGPRRGRCSSCQQPAGQGQCVGVACDAVRLGGGKGQRLSPFPSGSAPGAAGDVLPGVASTPLRSMRR